MDEIEVYVSEDEPVDDLLVVSNDEYSPLVSAEEELLAEYRRQLIEQSLSQAQINEQNENKHKCSRRHDTPVLCR